MNETKKATPVITVDGPSGTGKGTISQKLAKHLGWHMLDSGAIYRVLAYAAQENKLSFSDINAIVKLAGNLDLHFEAQKDQPNRVILNGKDVSDAIRTESCGRDASKIAASGAVREALLQRQRQFSKSPGLIADGRDMGTVVFPGANMKIYLDASLEERAKRRYLQLQESKKNARLADVVEELKKRDDRDTNRAEAPLKPADDAIYIDTTNSTIDQVFQSILALKEERL